MAVPKKKTSRARRNKRRAGGTQQRVNLISCPQCKKMIPPHRVCPYCGNYRGRVIIDLEEKEKKKKAKQKRKQAQ